MNMWYNAQQLYDITVTFLLYRYPPIVCVLFWGRRLLAFFT